MNFGDALIALQQGRKITRAGWNGQGMSVQLVYPAPTTNGRGMLDPYFAINLGPAKSAVWTPTTADTLAFDWALVP